MCSGGTYVGVLSANQSKRVFRHNACLLLIFFPALGDRRRESSLRASFSPFSLGPLVQTTQKRERLLTFAELLPKALQRNIQNFFRAAGPPPPKDPQIGQIFLKISDCQEACSQRHPVGSMFADLLAAGGKPASTWRNDDETLPK